MLNATERRWKDIKREITQEIIADRNHFRVLLTVTFLGLGHWLTFVSGWIETFLPNVQTLM